MNLTRAKRTDFEIPRLPLVALIDVIFFILLYFIMVGNLSPEENNLATALRTDRRAAGAASNLVPQIVSVDGADGKVVFKLGERVMGDKKALTDVLKGLSKEGGVVLRVGPTAPVHGVAAAVQAAKDAGFVKISYVPRGGA